MRELYRSPLLEIQKGIFFDIQVGDPSAYTISAAFVMDRLDLTVLKQSLQLVIHEQEALRSYIVMEEDGPQLVVVDAFDACVEELQQTSEELWINRDGVISEHLMESILSEPIDIFRGPLFSVYVSPSNGQSRVCIFKIHHIVCDGLSLELMKERLLFYYKKLERYETISLEIDKGFTQYIQLENNKLAEGKYEKHAAYWKGKLLQAEPVLIPPDKISHHEQSGVAKELRFPLTLHQQVTEIAKQLEVTPFAIYLTLFTLLLAPYSNQRDVTYVTPFTHRPKLSMEQSIGCFVHMLPIRMDLNKDLSFIELVQHQQHELIQTFKHAGYPNNLIARDSKQIRMPGMPSIFDISFVHDVIMSEHDDIRYISSDIVTFPGQMMVVIEQGQRLTQLKIQYKSQVYSKETIELLGNRFIYLMQQTCSNTEIKLKDLDYVLPYERELILHNFNASQYIPYEPRSIIECFEQRAAQHPQRVALLDAERQLTYKETEHAVNRLAAGLLDVTNGESRNVGIHMNRSIEMVISILAVLRAGCTYVPLDPSYPVKRKAFIVEDASIACVITDQPFSLELPIAVLSFSSIETFSELADHSVLLPKVEPSTLAYIMYTSGSTGNPKGVMVEQHSVVNTLLDLERRFPMTEHSVFMLKTAYTFDVSATELFGWFMGEGALFVLEPEGEKNPHLIVDCIDRFHITHLNFVPTMFRLFLDVIADPSLYKKLERLRYLFIGGEAITPELISKYNELQLNASLENVYGPTECTIWMSHYPLKQYNDQVNVPIGFPLNETRWYVVGERDELQPIGVIGELCLSGVGLARGYVNMPELTAEKFVANPFYNEAHDPPYYQKMYRTGDLVRWLPSGTIEYIGRVDFQVKLHGVRLEIGEIESALSNHPSIIQAVVIVKKLKHSSRLCAFYLSDQQIDAAEVKKFLLDELPSFMIPGYYVHLNEIPKNSSGKVDRKVLLAMLDGLQEEALTYVAPENRLEVKIAAVWEQVLNIEKPSVEIPFFELGGSSISLIQAHTKLQQLFTEPLPITVLFQYVTIRQLAEYLSSKQAVIDQDRDTAVESEKYPEPAQTSQSNKKRAFQREDIAIIGLAVRVPGANSIEQFWRNLMDNKESIHFYSDDELRQLGIDEQLIGHPQYVKAKGRVDGIDTFDHQLFGYTPGEVQMMSPQYRLLYKGVWDAFEDAGYDPTTGEKRIGLYVGGSDDFQWYRHMLLNDSVYSDQYQTFTLSTNHFLATRIAYKLNLKGPVYTALTGCSTSLVTPHLACQALQLGECDMAAAGGITVELPNEGGYLYEDGMMFSEDGHCRPFDASASGTMFSNGLGVVILKRLSDAIHDRDHIYGVIKGSAINNDGNSKLGFLAPSVEGQVDVIRQALEVAAVDPRTISYVEAHGTGTLLGDPIEVTSLTQAFSIEEKQQCVLGSVKGNVGHMDTAAGIIGLAKVALSLKHRYIPGTVNYEQSNPKIAFEDTPFIVQRKGEEWQPTAFSDGLLRAGINSFGVGGTNAHMVLEQAPIMNRKRDEYHSYHMMLVSAKTATALEANARQLTSHMLQHNELLAEDVAWTLQVGRKHFNHRKAIVVDSNWQEQPEQWQQLLEAPAKVALPSTRKLVFMFPGQGSQYQGMGKDLMQAITQAGIAPIFRAHMEEMFTYMPEEQRDRLITILYGDVVDERINQTQYSQLAIFMTSYALAMSLKALGVQPDAMLGHSIGELVAATVAGVFTLKDAVRIVMKRGELMQQQPAGVMLAIMSPPERIVHLLSEDLSIALYNSSNACVVGGPVEQIEQFKQKLAQQQIQFAAIKTSHAFHTKSMAEAAQKFEAYLSSNIEIHSPALPALSNVTGDWIDPQSWLNPSYWAQHITEAVRFEQNLDKVLDFEHAVFIEVGAGRTLSTFARTHHRKKDHHYFVSMLRHPQQNVNDEKFITERISELWCYGVEVSFKRWYEETPCYRVSLPTYQYDGHVYPITFASDLSSPTNANAVIACAPQPYNELALRRSEAQVEAAVAVENNDQSTHHLVLSAYMKLFGHEDINENSDFFELGGDSLKAVSLASMLQQLCGVKLGMQTLFDCVTPKSLAEYLISQHPIQSSNHQQPRGLIKNDLQHQSPSSGAYPLSSAQHRMYTLSLLYPDDITWNVPSATIINGTLNEEKLKHALSCTMQRHEALRTSIERRDSQLLQLVHETVNVPITFTDYRDQQRSIEEIIKTFVRPFDLTKAPLLRVEVARLHDAQSVLLFDVHHIIADGTSVELITNDINRYYFGESVEPALPYHQFIDWLTKQKQDAAYEEARQYWVKKLQAPRVQLTLTTDYERPDLLSNQGARVHFDIPASLLQQLKAIAAQHQASMNMVMLTAWKLLLYRYSSQQDIIVGVAASGRPGDMFKHTVGMFVNMLPIRNTIVTVDSFAQILHRVKTSMLEALNYDYFQFDDLVQALAITRERNRNLLFDVCFDYQNMDTYELELDGMSFEPYNFDLNCASYDLLLTCHEHRNKQNISGFIEYRTELFSESTIITMIEHLLQLLETVVTYNNESAPIDTALLGNHQLSLGSQHSNVLSEIEDLYSYFAEQVTQSNEQAAIIESSGHSLTYAQLSDQVEQYATLLHQKGIREGDRVGLLLKRTSAIHASMLACIKLNAVFVPIDPGLPKERIQYMLQQSDVSLVLCDNRQFELPVRIAFIDERWSYSSIEKAHKRTALAVPTTIAHIYTSGSTGMPKGVKVSAYSLINFIEDVRLRGLFAKKEDRIFSVTTASFDIFLFESIVPLCLGHSIYIANEQEQLDPSLAAHKIVQHRCTHLLSTVSRVKAFVEHPYFTPALSQLSCILTGGENVPASLVEHLLRHSHAALFNMYGPTETTIWSTVKQLTNASEVTIGRPIRNTEVYIVNDLLELVPAGQYGELLIGGAGVSEGYVGDPQRTQEQFIMLPNVSSKPLYRTGDRAKMLATGELQLLGRLDNQVKIRGYRIELSEIEEQLLHSEHVQYAVAAVRAEGTEYAGIITFVTLTKQAEDGDAVKLSKQLKYQLSKVLPQYMLPAEIIVLQQMPTLPNGKLDRKRLAEMANTFESQNAIAALASGELSSSHTVSIDQHTMTQHSSTHDLTTSKLSAQELKQRLIKLWEQTLQRGGVQLKQNYFDLGGQSLGLITIHGELCKWLAVELPLIKLFEYPTIDGLVDYLIQQQLVTSSISIIQEQPVSMTTKVQPVTKAAVITDNKTDHAANISQQQSTLKHVATDIAVIGMACQFPGAKDVHQYWNNLVEGVASIRTFTEEELLASGVPLDEVRSDHYVAKKGYLEDVEYFDHQFFHYSLHEAELMDPQIRLLHQVTWHALEDGGYDPYSYDGKIGFFAGSGLSTPWLTRFIGEQKDLVQLFEAMTLNEKDYVTTRVSYKLNLRGPSTNVQTACSTSLVAIHQAIQSLLNNEADMALAGGVSLSYPLKEGYMWHNGMIYSKDGYCRPFSDGASGTLSGNGCGVVLLKRLEQAIADGDHIYAVVKGSAVNNDGYDKIGYTAPSVSGQKEVIQRALNIAQVSPEQIRYVEAHGTGTQLGDPIELNALQQAWQANSQQYCAIGSVKANIGHLDAAAGVAGFIKAVCVAQTRTAPPLVHYKAEHPHLSLEHTPFYINTTAQALSTSDESIAVAVSSFGIGGTNAHVILSSSPELEQATPAGASSDIVLLPVSAASRQSLQHNAAQLKDWIMEQAALDMEQVAYTLQKGRAAFQYRQVIVMEKGQLSRPEPFSVAVHGEGQVEQSLWSFVNRLSLYKGVTVGLFRSLLNTPVTEHYEQHFTRLLAKLDAGYQQQIKLMMRDGIAGGDRAELLFSFIAQYSLFKALLQLGLLPDLCIGQGVGELVAWCLMQELTEDEALAVILRCPAEFWSTLSPGMLQYASYNDDQLEQMPHELQRIVGGIKQNHNHFNGSFYDQWDSYEQKSSVALEQQLNHWLQAKPTIIIQLTEGQVGLNDQLGKASTTYSVFLLSEQFMQEGIDEATMVWRGLAQCWCYGLQLPWDRMYAVPPRKISMPGYCFERTSHEHDVKLSTMLGMKITTVEEGVSQVTEKSTAVEKWTKEQLTTLLIQGWKEQLGDVEVKPQSDLFELGAHSLHVIALVAYIKRVLQLEVSIEEVFSASQFADMLQLLSSRLLKDGQVETEGQVKPDVDQVAAAAEVKYDREPFVTVTEDNQDETLLHEVDEDEIAVIHEVNDELVTALHEVNHDQVAALSKVENDQHLVLKANDRYAASSAQARLYIIQEVLGSSTAYHLASFYKVIGSLDEERFRTVIDALVARHESFRTSFQMENGQLYQTIHANVPSVLEVIECRETDFNRYAKAYVTPFDLSEPSLLRVKLFRFAVNRYGLMIDMHHIISDQTSIAILLSELTALYAGELLPEPEHHYRDYTAWQNEQLSSNAMLRQRQYWKQQFSGGVQQLGLVTDYERSTQAIPIGEKISISLPNEICSEIVQLSRQQGLTPFMLFIGTLELLIWKYSDAKEVVVGTAIAGRRQQEWQSIVGMFVNMLPIRIEMNKELTVQQFMQQVKLCLLQAFDHQDYPYEMLVDDLKLTKQLNRNPLFDVVMNYINMGTQELGFGDLIFESFTPIATITPKFDMTWTVIDQRHDFTIEVEFNTSLYRRSTIERMLARYVKLLTQVMSSISQRSEQAVKLDMMTLWDEADEQWLAQCNATAIPFPVNDTIPKLFVDMVQRMPEHVALRYGKLELSYTELNQKVNALTQLLKEHGAVKGQRIGLYLSRGPMQMISIFAVLKLGCVYVPIDTKQPMQRTQLMLHDSEASFIITEQSYHGLFANQEFSGLTIITAEQLDHVYDANKQYEEPDLSLLSAEDEVYIVYTSGSTGIPKGVLISHRNVLKVVRNSNFIAVKEADRIIQLSTYAFDGSVFDIFGALLNGATLVLSSEEQLVDIEQLANLIETEQITVMFITTALFNLLVDLNIHCLSNMRCIMFGGEAASYDHVKKAVSALGAERLLNVYGPTETTFIATFHRIADDEDLNHHIPIGQPLSNTTLYVLDEQGRPVPSHIIGELYIGGAGVGLGYVNRPELTEERFIDDIFSGSGKLYRTGDRVWRRQDGALVYVERADFQVKIRGFRVELGEIEAQMKRLAEVKEAIVTVNHDLQGSTYLSAYYTERENHSRSEHEVYELLSAQLPEYMVPKRMMRLEQMPLTLTGKIDRSRLPIIDSMIRTQPIAAASNVVEDIVLNEMKAVLDVQELGIHDDFFHAGGQSLKAIALLQALKKHGIQLTIQDILSFTTAAKLADLPKLKAFAQELMQPEQETEDSSEPNVLFPLEASNHTVPTSVTVLDKHQIKTVIEQLLRLNHSIAQAFYQADIVHGFSWSSMQKVHAALGSSPSGFMTTIAGQWGQAQLTHAVVQLISKHQLLHSLRDLEQQRWMQVDIRSLEDTLAKIIPYYDASTLHQGKGELLDQLTREILLKPYDADQLCWRIAIVKLTAEEHRIIWGLDHVIFDGMSAQILMDELSARLHSQEIKPSKQTFERYIALLEQGPHQITEQELIDRFQLEAWANCQLQWQHVLALKAAAQASMPASDKCLEQACSLELKLELKHDQLQQQWWSALQVVVQAIAEMIGMVQLPFGVVHYGRQYGEDKFYNCVGEFLDIVPLTMSATLPEAEWFSALELVKHHRINFMALLHEKVFAKQYAGLRHYLQALAVTGQPYPCILFNFQGYIPAEDHVASNWQQDLGMKQVSLASMIITMYYDEKHLYVQLESEIGFEQAELVKHIQELSSSFLQWIDNKGVEVIHER